MKHFFTISLCFLALSLSVYGQEACDLEPDPGPCFAAIQAYYFNQETQTCAAFTWGGCAGVVPFSTLAECESACGFTSVLGCTTPFACNYDPEATIDDGSCEFICEGCTDEDACNYDPSANVDDSSCEFLSCAGCADAAACNFNSESTIDDGSCTYQEEGYTCDGTCINDSNGDGICDSFCEEDLNGDGVIGVQDLLLVLSEFGCNSSCENDINQDGYVAVQDILLLLSGFGNTCEISGFQNCGDLVSHDGYDYSTVLIGEQCWFSENCRYLPEVSPSNEGNTTDPYYYVYGYEGTDVTAAQATSNYATYGVLYNWPAVMTEGICPSGWHIPSDEEFTQLIDFLGGESVAGYAMKSTSGWDDGNGSNSSGWTGLPGAGRNSEGFSNIVFNGWFGFWWSASESGSDSWGRRLFIYDDDVYRDYNNRAYGFYARCVIDYTDECGVLNGDNSTCLDECGVPNGDSSTCADCGDLVAHEGYDYSTVWIGEQCWFSENCRYLPSVTANEDSYDVPMYYVYDYEGTDVAAAQATSNYETYGVLYNWPAVMTEGICPSGWHIPSDLEFTQLANFLGGENIAGEQMKSTSGWDDGGNGSNTSGWTGLPGGGFVPGFNFDGYIGSWWSSSASDSSLAWIRKLQVEYVDVIRYSNSRNGGYSARCVRD